MGKTTVTLPDDLEVRFRKTVADTLGFKKGNLQQALIEALEDWIKKNARKKKA